MKTTDEKNTPDFNDLAILLLLEIHIAFRVSPNNNRQQKYDSHEVFRPVLLIIVCQQVSYCRLLVFLAFRGVIQSDTHETSVWVSSDICAAGEICNFHYDFNFTSQPVSFLTKLATHQPLKPAETHKNLFEKKTRRFKRLFHFLCFQFLYDPKRRKKEDEKMELCYSSHLLHMAHRKILKRQFTRACVLRHPIFGRLLLIFY